MRVALEEHDGNIKGLVGYIKMINFHIIFKIKTGEISLRKAWFAAEGYKIVTPTSALTHGLCLETVYI